MTRRKEMIRNVRYQGLDDGVEVKMAGLAGRSDRD